MKRLDQIARALAFALLVLAYPASNAAGFDVPSAGGWYSWEVAAAPGGFEACCYRWRSGDVKKEGCDLDGNNRHLNMQADCDVNSDRIRVYVYMNAGTPSKLSTLSADCPVRTDSDVTDLGLIEPAMSVAWLAARVDSDSDLTSDFITAISMHAGDAAFDALTTLLEDRSRDMEIREEALFWLAQSESSEAYDYLDRLLSDR